ncbi:MAG: DUF2278 family protein [Micropruina sp.]|nr:DUF2278 family protein [Micropruina sp.]
MPLSGGYGLVIGTKHDYFRDPPDNFGRFYHGNLVVAAPLGTYKCAIGGGHDAENAIWQDGATIAETADGQFLGFLNKFTTQAFKTDDLGRPA